jgi:Holliday junction resolvase
MILKDEFLAKPLHDAAINQLIADYVSQGYDVKENQQIEGIQVDLIATKGETNILIQVKTARSGGFAKNEVKSIAEYVNSHPHYRYKVVMASKPSQKKIELEGFDAALLAYLKADSSKLNVSSTIQIDEIESITFNKVKLLMSGELEVEGTATLVLSDSALGDAISDAILLSFNVIAHPKDSGYVLVDGLDTRLEILNEPAFSI